MDNDKLVPIHVRDIPLWAREMYLKALHREGKTISGDIRAYIMRIAEQEKERGKGRE